MTEQEFWETYRSSQTNTIMSDELKSSILKNTRQEEHKEVGVKSGRRNRRTLFVRVAVPLAACLALLAMTMGIFSLMSGTDDKDKVPGITSYGFTVRAYAADTDTVLEMGSENQILFGRVIMPVYPSADSNQGHYTGSLFRVEGEGIVRIQASISTGAIYRYSVEEVRRGDNMDRWRELISWKPTKRGMGDYFGKYDDVFAWGGRNDDNIPKDSPDWKAFVGLSKKLGSTIDVTLTEGSPNYSYGFWTNEVSIGSFENEADDMIIDSFEGAILTVTVTFEDGHAATQIIELHTGDVISSQLLDENGVMFITPTPELIDPDNTELKPYEYTHILYGIVIDANQGPFPGSLDNANEFEYITSAPMAIPGVGSFELIRPYSVTIDPSDIHDPSDSIQVTAETIEEGNVIHAPVTISNLKVSRSKSLPDGITLDDLRSGMGSWEYFNSVTGQLDGYTLDGLGTPTEGFSWAMLELDIRNDYDSQLELTADGSYRVELAIYDENGNVSTIVCRSFALLNGGWDSSKAGMYMDLALKPGETTTIRWLMVVPDFAYDDPTLFFLGAAADSPERAQGFALHLS